MEEGQLRIPQQPMMRVTLFGDAGAGKSAMLRALKGKSFDANYMPKDVNYTPTIGVEFESYEPYPECKQQIWDTAGQERFGAIVKSYFLSAHALIFVVDGTQPLDEKKARKWLEDAKAAKTRGAQTKPPAPEAQYYIAVTKFSDNPLDPDFQNDQKLRNIANEVGITLKEGAIVRCLATQPEGIKGLFSKVADDYMSPLGLETHKVQVPKKVSGEKESLEAWRSRNLPNVLIGGGVVVGVVTAAVLFTLAFTAGSVLTFGILPSAFIGAAILTAAVVAGWAIGSAIIYRMSDAYKNRNKEPTFLINTDNISSLPTNVPPIPEKKVEKIPGVEHKPSPFQPGQPSDSSKTLTSSSSPSPQQPLEPSRKT